MGARGGGIWVRPAASSACTASTLPLSAATMRGVWPPPRNSAPAYVLVSRSFASSFCGLKEEKEEGLLWQMRRLPHVQRQLSSASPVGQAALQPGTTGEASLRTYIHIGAVRRQHLNGFGQVL